MGGEASLHIFNELRLAYFHGLYFATVLLVLAYVEKELAGFFYVAGRNSARRATLEELCLLAHKHAVITKRQLATLQRLRGIRNGHAHYRSWKDKSPAIRRAIASNKNPWDRVETDAAFALRTLGEFLARQPGSQPQIVKELRRSPVTSPLHE